TREDVHTTCLDVPFVLTWKNILVSVSSRSTSLLNQVAVGFGNPVNGAKMEKSSPARTVTSLIAPRSILGLFACSSMIIGPLDLDGSDLPISFTAMILNWY